MDELNCARRLSVIDQLSMRSESLRDDLKEVLKKLSFRKNSRKDSGLMSNTKRRFGLSVLSIILLLPISLLLSVTVYFICPKAERLHKIQEAMTAYKVSRDMRTLSRALAGEWNTSHRYLMRLGDKRQLRIAWNLSDEHIQQSEYVPYCVSHSTLPVSTKKQLQGTLKLIREYPQKRARDVAALYRILVRQIYSCGIGMVRRIDVEEDSLKHVIYHQLLAAELHLSVLQCHPPVTCRETNETFLNNEILTLANIASSKLSLARYFHGDRLWWMNGETSTRRIASWKSAAPLCKEMQEGIVSMYNTTLSLTDAQFRKGIEILSKMQQDEYHGLLLLGVAAVIFFILGTCPVPFWMFSASTDIQILTERIREVSNMTSNENSRANSVVSSIVPIKYVSSVRQRKVLRSPESYESITVLILSLSDLTNVMRACSPTKLISIMSFILNLVEERISLYKVHILQRTGCTFFVASGMNTHSGFRHVTEIANLSLDLLNSCSDLELDVLPNTRVQLRMGINTGPCIGTVPCHKPLRYHLVGRTVKMAAKLEETSELNAIHISKTTAKLLEAQRCYRLEKTGDSITLDSGLEQESEESYWLLGRPASSMDDIDEGKDSATEPHPKKVELALKPMYKYDSKQNMYLPLANPSPWYREQRSRNFFPTNSLSGDILPGIYEDQSSSRHRSGTDISRPGASGTRFGSADLEKGQSYPQGDALISSFCNETVTVTEPSGGSLSDTS